MTIMVPLCERCDRAQDIHGEAGRNGWDHDFAPITLVEHGRRQRVADRRTQALWYAWGREDCGDRRLRDASGERVLAFDFADFAARECERYVREESCHLAPVQDQHERFVAALTPGSRFVCEATGDVFRVDAYMANANETFATVVDGPHGCPSTVPVGGRITFTPKVLAGYRLAAVEAVRS
jgi:hypothetical protein